MQHSKLINLLGVLSDKELTRLGMFLDAPYHNTNKFVTKLYKYILRYWKSNKTSKLSKITAHKHLFEGTPYKDTRIRGLMSTLLKLTEEFLAFEQMRGNETCRKNLLIKSLAKRKDYRRFEKEVEVQIKKQEENDHKSIDDYLEITWLHHQLYFHPCTKKFTTKNNFDNLQALIKNQDKYFLFSRLLYGVELQSRQKLFKENYKVNFLRKARSVSDQYQDPAKRFKILRACSRFSPIGF